MTELTPHLQQVNTINQAITARRREFVSQYRNKQMGSTALTYEPALDRGVYQTLREYRHMGTAYEHTKNELNAYTEFQVETFIGERLNVGLSEFRYDLRDGKMYGQGMDESLVEMIQRGRDCRDAIARDVDKLRQDAEVEQFTKIQEVMGAADVGTTVISISPPGGEGSSYAHNFYDVFVLSEDEVTNERFVAAHRYASELSVEEYQAKAQELTPGYFAEYKNEPIDSYFLSHPLVLDTKSVLSGKPDAIHALFHKDHEFLSTEDFQEVRRSIAGLIMSYVNTLCDSPDDADFLHLTLNAIMNKADSVADNMRHAVRRGEIYVPQEIPKGPIPHGEIMRLGQQPVRTVATGCGSSSGFGQEDRTPSNMSSFSSGDLGKDAFGSRTFSCPECGEVNLRPVNELLSNCQHCGSEKVAC